MNDVFDVVQYDFEFDKQFVFDDGSFALQALKDVFADLCWGSVQAFADLAKVGDFEFGWGESLQFWLNYFAVSVVAYDVKFGEDAGEHLIVVHFNGCVVVVGGSLHLLNWPEEVYFVQGSVFELL